MKEENLFYLTKEGLKGLKKEQESLKRIKFSKTKGESPKILHSEDINPEYISFYEDLNFIETRLAEINNVLNNFKLIEMPSVEKRNIISLGATVLVEVDGQEDEFKMVGSLEANPSLGRISNESPVGRALLNHKTGEEVIVSSPIKTNYKIKKIEYDLT